MLMRRYGSFGMSFVCVLFLLVGLMPANAEAMALSSMQSSSTQEQIFPIRDQISFSSQNIDEMFVLTDGSMWIISGTSDGQSTGWDEANLTIYAGTDALPQPEYGVKSDYFMLIEGRSTTYFVKPLPTQNQIITDLISFSSQNIDEMFVLTDGSMWIISGTSDGQSTGWDEANLTIYAGTGALPQPEYGVKSDYFMLIEGRSTTYFVKPLPPQTQIITDLISFSSQNIDEMFVLTNGSMWIISGTSDGQSTGWDEANLKIYAGTDALPQPEYGVKSDYFMLIEGRSTTYFVNPLSPIFSLSVSKTGNGTVTSSPAGINCGTTCSAGFSSGASVTLTAAPATADATVTWSGCTPVATNPQQCTVNMTANRTVTATFGSGSDNGAADFVVTRVKPTRPVDGITHLSIVVKNEGDDAGDAGVLTIWSNQGATPFCGASGDLSATVGTLEPGASRTLTFHDLVLGTAATNTFRAFVDSDCETEEANENNNQFIKTYRLNTGSGDAALILE